MPIKKFFSKSKQDNISIDKNNIPKHVAIIMDGNGRWAQKRHLPRIAGHKAGAEALKRTVLFCDKIGIKYLSVYVFSTENWKRPEDEVSFIMKFASEVLKREIQELHKKNAKLNFLGDLSKLPQKVQEEFNKAFELTKNNSGLNLNLLINYGSRAEIINAIKNIAKDSKNIDTLDEKRFSEYLFTKGIPDPDLLIRTGGDFRVSNFLLWQIAYSEIWVTNKFWPDFSDQIFTQAIYDFQNRERRFGGLNKE